MKGIMNMCLLIALMVGSADIGKGKGLNATSLKHDEEQTTIITRRGRCVFFHTSLKPIFLPMLCNAQVGNLCH
jgi:hypothetical protein